MTPLGGSSLRSRYRGVLCDPCLFVGSCDPCVHSSASVRVIHLPMYLLHLEHLALPMCMIACS